MCADGAQNGKQKHGNIKYSRCCAFEASAEVHEKRVLLIDDIMTTGSTALACSNALREKGAAKICVLTVLKTQSKTL